MRKAGTTPRLRGRFQRLHEPIVSMFVKNIVSGRLAVGASLPNEGEIAERHGVSRTAAREAMQKLQSLGLIETRRRVGGSVRARDAWNMLDPDVLDAALQHAPDARFFNALGEARLLIEPRAAELAALRASKTDIAAIERAFEAMVAEAKTVSRPGWPDADLAFHAAIIEATGNWVFRQFIVAIRAALLASFRLTGEHMTSADRAIERHRAVLAAIQKKDSDMAHTAMKWLLLSTMEEFEALAQRGLLDRPAPVADLTAAPGDGTERSR